MRWLISWVGGPAGYVNPNKEATVINENCVVGMMNLFKGQQQKGLHYHSVTEIYVILKGNLESYDGNGEKTYAGPMDCIYIPKGVPHGVRNCGDDDCELIWVHDGIEKIGTSVYFMDGVVTGGYTQEEDISMVRFTDLKQNISAPLCAQEGYVRWMLNWVAGPSSPQQGQQQKYVNYSQGFAVESEKVDIGMTVLKPKQAAPLQQSGLGCTYLVMSGSATFMSKDKQRQQKLTRLDGAWVPKGTPHKVVNSGEDDLYLMWVHEFADEAASLKYLENE